MSEQRNKVGFPQLARAIARGHRKVARRPVGLRGTRARAIVVFIAAGIIAASGCNQPPSSQGGAASATISTPSSSAGTTGGPASGASGTTGGLVTSASINAFQVITKADPGASFDPVSVPLAGGSSVKASRIFGLDGSLIASENVPPWYVESRVFLTSTRTSPGAPSNKDSDTPCAYFDTFANDNNPETTGFYTIDGYNPSTAPKGSDVDQCAGTAASELNQLGLYVRIDRRFMNPTDRLQIIVKAKAIDAPNTAPTPSSCVVGGYFDASNCTNQLYTLTLRTAPGASAKPFYILFPSAKALDLLSESVLLPISIDQSISTISIDRVKGGAIFYGLTIVRLQ
jgi:hypothetical protein